VIDAEKHLRVLAPIRRKGEYVNREEKVEERGIERRDTLGDDG